MSSIQTKRVYDPPTAGDGLRVLVDRLWPRGVAKAKLKLDRWAKEIAPSHELRRWYHGDMSRFAEFRRRYLAELAANAPALDELRAQARGRTVTLLTASTQLERSHAAVLAELLTS